MTFPEDFKPSNTGTITTNVKVMSWNLWWQFGPWQERASAIEATIKAKNPDLVGLQEVWGDEDENFGKSLAEKLGYHYFYAKCMTMNGVGFGNAILSRWPILDAKTTTLSGFNETGEVRNAMFVKTDGPRGEISFFNTHLNWRYEQSHIRQKQVEDVAGFVKENSSGKMPPIITGDFNAEPLSEEIRRMTGLSTSATEGMVFHDAWLAAGKGKGNTWNNKNPFAAAEYEPDRRIDYIFSGHPKARGRGQVTKIKKIGNKSVNGIWPSDHFGLLAKIRY